MCVRVRLAFFVFVNLVSGRGYIIVIATNAFGLTHSSQTEEIIVTEFDETAVTVDEFALMLVTPPGMLRVKCILLVTLPGM